MAEKNKKRIQIIMPDRMKEPVGGVGVQFAEIYKRLGRDFTFDVLAQPEENGIPDYTGVFNPLTRIAHNSLVTIAGQISYFYEATQRPKPDLVHGYDWSTYFAAVYAARFWKVPLIVTMQLSINLLEKAGISYAHNPETVDGSWIHRTHCEMERYGLEHADTIIQVSNAYLSQFNAPDLAQKTVVIPNGIDLDLWQKAQKIRLPGNRPFKVVYIGRFALMKGVLPLLEARIPEAIDLIFVGKGDGGEGLIFEKMKEKTERERNVHYIGPRFGQDKIDTLHSADAVIVPSIHEPFGIVALEALAARTILISSFSGGMSDFLKESVALRCDPEPRSIESSLNRLMALSPAERESRIEKGLEICRSYSWDSAAQMTKKAYEDTLECDPELKNHRQRLSPLTRTN